MTGILVTGAHRSGTTWIGRVLAASAELHYIQEPFHPLHHRGVFRASTSQWFTYVTVENEDKYRDAYRQMISFEYCVPCEVRGVLRGRDPRASVREARGFRSARRRGLRPLVKDPLAVFSTEWLVNTFALTPIILVRHPAAFATSLISRSWSHPFADFLAQPLLMRDLAEDFRSEIEAAVETPLSLLAQAGLLWRIIYGTVATFRARHDGWLVLRHEDLVQEPVAAIADLYTHLGLEFGDSERAAVIAHMSAPGGAETSGSNAIVRDPVRAANAWRTQLSPADIRWLRNDVCHISDLFYDDIDW